MSAHLLVGSSPLGMIPRVMDEIAGTRVLDVGCGCGVYGYLLRNKWQDTPAGHVQFRDFANRDIKNDQPALLAGVDAQLGSVKRCASHNIYDFLALARAEGLPFPENYVDTILCIEVLEHLEKPAALKAIRDFERIAAKRIIVTVPKDAVDPHTGADERAFLKIDTADPAVREWIEAETHRCSFTPAELKNLGFRVGRAVRTGARGVYDRALNAWYKHGPRAGQILAVKDLHKPNIRYSDEISPAPRTTESFPDYR
jgi:ubiquinone/menaquinone biosynthesis C-methylase UbiE